MPFPAVVDLDDIAAGWGGFKIQGEDDGDHAGGSVSAAGDVNGDGFVIRSENALWCRSLSVGSLL